MLSNLQKRLLSQLADRAFNRATALARARGEEPETNTAARAKFRHDAVEAAVGKRGLRCCGQADYKTIEAHLLDLCGEPARAMRSHMAAETDTRRRAEWKLFHEIQAAADAGLTVPYVEAICRAQFHCGITEASEKQLWRLVYTVRNRAAAKRKQGRAVAAAPPTRYAHN